MSIWVKTQDKLPPLNEEVLILYKDKRDIIDEGNLFYGIAKRVMVNPFCSENGGYERWSSFTEYQGFYEVVFWCQLVDMPTRVIKEMKEEIIERLKAEVEE